ncbi:MAG: twin-arginine translocase TatA/TatE family subunit [Bacteroidales bacterium]|nr:twin-arginine translocase TatA/TatE family subunit [Bacteroidales bacterium]
MKTMLFLGSIGLTEILVIALIVLLFFGGKKIPELMKGIGKGVRSFKEGVKGIEDELKDDAETEQKK